MNLHRPLSHLLVLGVIVRWASALAIDNSTYWEKRDAILSEEQETILGQTQTLTAEEQLVNDHLMSFKTVEMNEGFNSLNFAPAKHFMKARDQIEASEVFKILQMMPKGGALHLHDTTLASISWVIEEVTYWPDLYMCDDPEGQLFMKFMETPDSTCMWELVSDLRNAAPTEDDFNLYLFQKLSLFTENPDEVYQDLNSVWAAFESKLTALTGMIMYKPAWESYFYQFLKEFSQDNVLYVEFRGTLPLIYELDGTELSPLDTMSVYQDTALRFQNDHPHTYFETRFIYAPPRHVDNATMWEYVSLVQQLKTHFPDFVAGFDLVGQEDLGLPLRDFLEPLLTLTEQDIPVFYHAGETNWMGMSTDENLIDALLLNASRIGHAYALTKHPVARALALDNNVAIEVCPISNQILMLVDDLRNHPVASLAADGFPIIISSDDPATWGALPLSHDFYEAFMALGGAKADLRFLKQLAKNSIMYSSLTDTQKSDLMSMWQVKWDEFIGSVIKLYNLNEPNLIIDTDPTSTNQIENNEILFSLR